MDSQSLEEQKSYLILVTHVERQKESVDRQRCCVERSKCRVDRQEDLKPNSQLLKNVFMVDQKLKTP